MSYVCQHPEMGALRHCHTALELLEIKEAIFHAVLMAAAEDLHQHHPQLSDGLSFAALEYRDAVKYALAAPQQPDEQERAVRHD